MPLIIPVEYAPAIQIVYVIMGIAASLMAIIGGVLVIVTKIKKARENPAQQKPKYFKIEKNAVLLAPFPIVKSPKGYIYSLDKKPKDRILYCGKCCMATSKRIPLSETGSRFSKELVCPDCETVYGK